MGMAASQARLLCITARIHDVEYQAQSIQNAKMQLATLSDRAYQDYLTELDASTLTIMAIDPKSGAKSTIPATFNTLCSKNRVLSADSNEYAIRDKSGRLLVEKAVYEAYTKFQTLNCSKDAYTFAMYMISGDTGNNMGPKVTPDGESNIDLGLRQGEEIAYQNATKGSTTDKLYSLRQTVLTAIEDAGTKLGEQPVADDIYDQKGLVSRCGDSKIQERYQKAMNAYKEELYRRAASDVLVNSDAYTEGTTYDELAKNFNQDEFNYYLSIYKQIQACGGCRPITDYNGLDGDAANNSDWLQAMIKCGELTLEIADKNSDGSVNMETTSPSSNSAISYTPTTEIDKKAYALAEAKYEKALKDIDKKDKQFDLSLSKLETERSALTTQYESLQKVIDENIERTFGIFS